MRVKLHGVSHDIRHFVISSVVHTLHGVHDAPLYGFESVFDIGDGSLQNHIGGIVQEPVLVHTAEVVNHSSIKPVDRLVIRMTGRRFLFHFLTCFFLF